MRIGVLGTGMVGRTIGSKLAELGHEVRMGSRSAGNEAAVAWADEAGDGASEGDFGDAAGIGELIFNCTAGGASLEALAMAGEANLHGKVLVDVANPLDFSGGMPPTLSICNDDSLGERIQAAFPETLVVKALNTMNCSVMVDPDRVPGEHVAFVCGENTGAKDQVAELLGEFGWPADRIVDLGGIAAARGTEMYLPLWLALYGKLGTGDFNVAIERAG
ncbi:MAG: NAD(P)-binding domain-containing protein [Solirubrobacterales bacterium]